MGEVTNFVGKALRAVVGAEHALDPEEAAAQRALDEAREVLARAQQRLDVALSELESERDRQAEDGKLDPRRLTDTRRMVSAAEDELTLARRIEARAAATLEATRQRIWAQREAEAVNRASALLKEIKEHGGKAVAAMEELRGLYGGAHQRRLPPALAMWTEDAYRHWLSTSRAILAGGDEAA